MVLKEAAFADLRIFADMLAEISVKDARDLAIAPLLGERPPRVGHSAFGLEKAVWEKRPGKSGMEGR
jgi:hypothetical protein